MYHYHRRRTVVISFLDTYVTVDVLFSFSQSNILNNVPFLRRHPALRITRDRGRTELHHEERYAGRDARRNNGVLLRKSVETRLAALHPRKLRTQRSFVGFGNVTNLCHFATNTS